jgi:hypothetical protein
MMASLFTFLEAWKTTSKLLESFSEAYIMWKVQKIRSEHQAINGARDEIIKGINLARAQRDSVKLTNFNRALYMLEHYSVLQQHKNKDAQG